MKSTSSGSGLRSVLAMASTPRSATRRRRISASISFLSWSMRCSYSSCSRRSSSGVSGSGDVARGPAPSAARARRRGRGSAACGTGSRCRRRAGPAPCRRSGCTAWRASGPHQGVVALHAAPCRASRPAPRATWPRPTAAGPALAPRRLASGRRRRRRARATRRRRRRWRTALPRQREVDLEHGLEGAPVGVVLHQRGGQGVLEGLPVLERDVRDRLHGVEVLGQADREPGRAQLADEPAEQRRASATRADRPRQRSRRPRGGGHDAAHEVARARRGAAAPAVARRAP